jgi:hypothetical protein
MQCKHTRYALGFRNQNPRHGETVPILGESTPPQGVNGGTLESRRLPTWILNLYEFTTRNIMNQLYYSKGYQTIEIGGLFCVTGYLKSVFKLT